MEEFWIDGPGSTYCAFGTKCLDFEQSPTGLDGSLEGFYGEVIRVTDR